MIQRSALALVGASLALLSGCGGGTKQVRLTIVPSKDMNETRSCYLLARAVDEKLYGVESYDDVAAKAMSPDASVSRAVVVLPGVKQEITVPVPEKGRIAVYALLRRFRPAREVMDLPPQQRALPPDVATDLANPRQTADTAVGYLTVPAVLVRLLLPFATLVAVYLFMRGHNEPGGGFIGGLLAVTASVLWAVALTGWSLRLLGWLRPAG